MNTIRDLHRRELFTRLRIVARRVRDAHALATRRRIALVAGAVSLLLALAGLAFPSFAVSSLYLIFFVALISVLVGWFKHLKMPLNFIEAAQAVENEHPELNQALVTAVQESGSTPPSFLGRMVTDNALRHPSASHWHLAAKSLLRREQAAYAGSILLLLGIMGISYYAAQQPAARQAVAARGDAEQTLTVLPGDSEVERGDAVVITARFDGPLPDKATLVSVTDTGEETRSAMAQSLSDPVFAFTLQQINDGLTYHVEFESRSSEPFRIEVFDLPSLARADVSLDFPDYTGWRDRVIEDTTRVSAIEGTELEYRFSFNKPLQQAYLENKDGERIELEQSSEAATQFAYRATVQQSQSFRLQLVDGDGRRNAFPTEIRIDALLNKRPELRLTQPKGDQRLTPIEEIALKGEAKDDFGLIDYGIAFYLGTESAIDKSLAESSPSSPIRKANLQTELALEQFELNPKDVVSWYLWAEDHGPDGKPRRSTSDLYFADIRAFDEAFREQDGGGQSGMGAGESQELIETQRRISISLFRIKNDATDAGQAGEDLEVINRSQGGALAQLRELLPLLQDPDARAAGDVAQDSMQSNMRQLSVAINEPSLEPLEEAWKHSQAAFQALLRLSSGDVNVSRSQNAGGGGGGQSPNQRQLNELEFRQAENRYETATQAQPLASPENLQDLQLLSRLNELSRRQQDLNDRLQEMQSALAEADSEAEKERLRRELKRLEEEQRQMMQAADEAIQQAGNREQARQARQELEEVRETMRQAGEQLQQGEVSKALASGARTREKLEQTRDSLRNQASSEFADAMRRAREQARELAESQQQLDEKLDDLTNNPGPGLDDSTSRNAVSEDLEAQRQRLKDLFDQIATVTESSEQSEPGLYRKLYDILRSQSGAEYDERYDMGASFLRQGFVEEARRTQEGVAQSLEDLSDEIAEAAATILGDETTTLRYAQQELDQLQNQLNQERGPEPERNRSADESQLGDSSGALSRSPSDPADAETASSSSSESSQQPDQLGDEQQSDAESGSTPGLAQSGNAQGSDQSDGSDSQSGPGGGGGNGESAGEARSLEAQLQDALSGWGGRSTGPLTGAGYGEWVDRLRTVESLMENPEVRQQLAQARETAESLRRDFKRHSSTPQWGVVEQGIVAPLNEARAWLKEELARNTNPDSLQPVDRDPVPQEYSEAVRRYYESLGSDNQP